MAGRPDLDVITATQLNLKPTYCSYLTDIYELTNLLETCSKLFLPPPPGLKNARAVGVAEKDTPIRETHIPRHLPMHPEHILLF